MKMLRNWALIALACMAMLAPSALAAADLSLTAASVLAGTGARTELAVAGATITAGQVVYRDPADGKMKLADNDSATAAVRGPDGIALNGASNGQPLMVLTEGPVTIGGTMTAGVAYYLSSTPGAIAPVGDLGSGDYPTIIGIATSTTVLRVQFQEAGAAL